MQIGVIYRGYGYLETVVQPTYKLARMMTVDRT